MWADAISKLRGSTSVLFSRSTVRCEHQRRWSTSSCYAMLQFEDRICDRAVQLLTWPIQHGTLNFAMLVLQERFSDREVAQHLGAAGKGAEVSVSRSVQRSTSLSLPHTRIKDKG